MIKEVKQFMETFGQLPNTLGFVELVTLRYKLIDEEIEELLSAKTDIERLDALVDILYVGIGTLLAFDYDTNGIEEALELDSSCLPQGMAISDTFLLGAETLDIWLEDVEHLMFLAIRDARQAGYDLNGAFDEVHRSNMSKLDSQGSPIYNQYGKVLKGPNYFKPNLAPFVGTDE